MKREHPQKKLAHLLYVEQGMEAKQIAQLLGISEQTLSKWVQKENWKVQRQARSLGPDKLILMYYEQSQLIHDNIKKDQRVPTPAEVDALAKLASSISKVDKTVSETIVYTVLSNFNNYMVLVNPSLAKQFVEHQLAYVQTLLERQ